MREEDTGRENEEMEKMESVEIEKDITKKNPR